MALSVVDANGSTIATSNVIYTAIGNPYFS